MRVLFPDPEAMQAADLAQLAFVPFLLSSTGDYPDAPNRYLRERALAEWMPPSSDSVAFMTKASCRTMASRLLDFLLWAESNGLDWREVEYTKHLIFSWQAGLATGACSRSGKRLAATTINPRVNEARMFLQWAAARGLRGPIHIPMVSGPDKAGGSGKHAHSHRQRIIEKRKGKLRVPGSQLSIPSPTQVAVWVNQIRQLKGEVKGLCCELIISTGIRITECIEWRVWTLPPQEEWLVIDGKVEVQIKYGAKGQKISPGSVEGPSRNIWVPLDLALRLNHYRELQRPSQIRRWINEAATREEKEARRRRPHVDRLFLGERSNRPFGASQLYQDWTGVPACPKNWHPHKGREFFAVETIIEATRLQMSASNLAGIPSLEWLHGQMAGTARIILQPVMGHVREETTHTYLRAARARLSQEIGHPALRWQQFLSREE